MAGSKDALPQEMLGMLGEANLFASQPYSARYRTLLEQRKKLPVFSRASEFRQLYIDNQVLVIVGETGSGKTTQIPQFVAYLDRPDERGKIIACTQPRRVAAMSASRRVAEEMDVSFGMQVGYTIRFEDVTHPQATFLKYMTDGMLLRESMSDPLLTRYSTIILDEAHERTLATDILMGLLKEIVTKRSDLKVILMSATLDAVKFQNYFAASTGPRPLLKVPGRMHPVETYYTTQALENYVEATIRTVLQIHQTEPAGDILVFLTGEEEIEDACRKIRLESEELRRQNPGTIGPLACVPIYSTLPPQQQQRIFEPAPRASHQGGPPGRKVVVATNIAETSLTIDGVVYVVDPGFVKSKVYNPRMRVESLLVSPISKASAQQRAGRAGRTRPGKCYRLFMEDDFERLEAQTAPEILRSNLANTVLDLMKLGVHNVARFDFVDPPAAETVMRALELLHGLGAVASDGSLTELGKILAEFPLDPQMSKSLLSSANLRCSDEVLTIVAMLSVPNVFMRPLHLRQEADAAKAALSMHDGDHLSLHNVYQTYLRRKNDRDWAWNNFLSLKTLQQAENVRKQIARMLGRFEIPIVSSRDPRQMSVNVRKSLICGYFTQVAHRLKGRSVYGTVKNEEAVLLHPSCGLEGHPEWILFNEFVLTTQAYVRTVTMIDPEWLLEYAPEFFDLAKYPAGEARKVLIKIANRREESNRSAKGKDIN